MTRASPPPWLQVRGFAAMGTPCEIRLHAQSPEHGHALVEAAIAEVRRLEVRYSRYRADSELSAINRVAAAGGRTEVDAETAALLDYAATCFEQSGGLFDVTSGILRQAWSFTSATLPDAALIDRLRQRVGWDRVHWKSPVLAFPKPGMEIDLGGIVKEYAADCVAALLERRGVRHGFINLGGDVRVVGPQSDQSPWRIGIRHPRQPDTLLSSIELRSGALASSGDYERCIVVDGIRYGHILNPRTGWPVQKLAAVSVAAPLCIVAGSAATIAMLKQAQGADWLREMQLPCLWVDVDGQCGGELLGEPPRQ